MFIYTDQISNRKYRIRKKKKKKQEDRISVSMGRMYGTASLTCVTYFTCIENERERRKNKKNILTSYYVKLILNYREFVQLLDTKYRVTLARKEND